MKVGEGGGNASEGEMIEVIEIPVSETLAFVMDETVETPVGLLFGVMWYMACKQKDCKNGGCSQQQSDITQIYYYCNDINEII